MRATALLLPAVLAACLPSPVCAGGFDTTEAFLRYLNGNRGDSALVSYTVRPDGTPDPADPILTLNADQPIPLGSTFKIVVLAAYAREVAAGRLDPRETVAVRDWEDYYLPGSDGGAHPAALAELKIPADEYGFATDPETRVPLDTLAHVMIQVSDNAATDYLMARLGRGALRETIAAAGLTGQDVPLPVLGQFLSWNNHEEGNLTWPRLRTLLALGPEDYTARVDRFAAAFQDADWRGAEFLFLLDGGGYSTWRLEGRAANAFFARGTARDYARIMAGVITGTFLSPEISSLMRKHLERPLPDDEVFLAYGSKGGSLAGGVLTEAAYFIPGVGDFAGKPHVSVVFQHRLSETDWTEIQEAFAQDLFSFRLGLDRTFARLVRRTLVRPR